MAGLGSPVIVPGSNGLMQLAHRTKFGLQTSIENFNGLKEARDFLTLHKMRAVFEVDGGKLSDKECALIVAMRGSTETVGDLAVALTSTPAWVGKAVKKLTTAGLACQIHAAKKRKLDVVALTDAGRALRVRMVGAP